MTVKKLVRGITSTAEGKLGGQLWEFRDLWKYSPHPFYPFPPSARRSRRLVPRAPASKLSAKPSASSSPTHFPSLPSPGVSSGGHLSRAFSSNAMSNNSSSLQQLHQAKNVWRKANAVCFDVDSTVIQEEAIDELANFCGKGEEVQQLTMEAMKGGMDFREALALRLDLIRPHANQLKNYIYSQKHRLTPYVKELVHELHKREKEVYLISGGFKSIIEPIARDLNIPTSNVYANRLKFFYDGEYAGFDENQCTSRSGGKGVAVRNLKERHGYETVVMIGDGITDWEAAPPADLFIGFGGNVFRNEVKNKAKWYVTDFRDLLNELRD